MNTFALLERQASIPMAASWLLADIVEARAATEVFVQRKPSVLRALRANALIESAVSSNRIEGVNVDQDRVRTVLVGGGRLRDRDEAEVRGYRDALRLIHDEHARLAVSEKTARRLHALSRAGIGDAGAYKKRDSDIIERLPDGDVRVRFKPVSAAGTPAAMKRLIAAWRDCEDAGRVHPLIAIAAFNLDFLCIHPFRDGNGRVSRLLLLLQCYREHYTVGRYVSFERLIEREKPRYYETLETSSRDWHTARHDPWPFIAFLLFVLKSAYEELGRVTARREVRHGGKTELVLAAAARMKSPFSLAQLCEACPGVGRDMVRNVLRQLRDRGEMVSTGRGPGARWTRKR